MRSCRGRCTAAVPTKDHILESACGGVALFDYDGDGLLDIYLVTGAGAHAGTRAGPTSQCPVSQPRRMEVRGCLQAGGRGSRSLGQRRVRRRFRWRRPTRSLRHQLGPERAVPQPWRRHVRGCGRRAPASRLAAGAPAARSSMPTATAIWTSMSRATSRRPGSPSCGAADAPLAQRATHHGRAGRTSRRVRSVLREPRQRTVRGGHRRARPHRPVTGLRLRRRGDRLRRRRVRRPVRRKRLEPEFPVSQPRERPLRKRRTDGGRGGKRRRRAPRRAWAPTPATTMATRGWIWC